MSKRRILTLYYKDLTLFFKGRRRIRQKAEIFYFITLFVVSFFLGILYRRVKIQTGVFALTFTFFLYLLMSFVFELKHFIFFDEDIKIIKRLPVLEREYYISKSLLILTFGILFTLITLLGHLTGAYIWASITLPFHKVLLTLLFNTFFSIVFSMLVYAILLRVFKNSAKGDMVAKVQISLGILFGLIFAFAPRLSPLLDAIDKGSLEGYFWFKLLPFTWFVSFLNYLSVKSLLISIAYILIPLYLAVILGFEERYTKKDEKVKSFEKFIFTRNRKKRSIFLLILTHILRSKITKRTLIAPTIINMVILFLWIFSKNKEYIVFFGVWTIIFMSVISSLALFISDSYKSSWMLKKAPMRSGEVIAYGLNAGFFYIVLPYAFFVFLVFILKGIPITETFLPLFYGVSVCYTFMQLLVVVRPAMIFSRASFERGINSLKELIVSFVLVPMMAGFFNTFYDAHFYSFLKSIAILFLIVGIGINQVIKNKL